MIRTKSRHFYTNALGNNSSSRRDENFLEINTEWNLGYDLKTVGVVGGKSNRSGKSLPDGVSRQGRQTWRV